MTGVRISVGGVDFANSGCPKLREFKGNSLLLFPTTYVVADIETTGLDPNCDSIIEIAAIKIQNGKEIGQFQSLVNPHFEIDEFIQELTGITNPMLESAPSIESVLPKFLEFVGAEIVVGHNVNFDINFIYDYAENLKLNPFCNDFVDTMRISRKLYKDLKHHTLAALIVALKVGETVEHRALADCVQTQQCFEIMRQRAEKIGGLPKKTNAIAKTLVAETNEFDEDSPIYGKTFAFTGTLEKMTRKEAMQIVINSGGKCTDNVVASTNFLVLGNQDYYKGIKDGKSNKQKKAEKMQLGGADIVTISESTFYDMLN
mgnify:CR=1 FL=1